MAYSISHVRVLSSFTLAACLSAGALTGCQRNNQATTGNSVEGTYPATISEVFNENTIRVQAHTWVGQYSSSVVCVERRPAVQPAATCDFAAKVLDASGVEVTNLSNGQEIYLRPSENVATFDFKGLRPRQDVVDHAVPATVLKAGDGDTFQVEAQPWPGQAVIIDIRVNGVDTPEKKGRAKCAEEAALAEKASAATADLVVGKRVYLYNLQYEKYGGRLLADVKTTDGVSVADNLIQKNLAHAYAGKTKQSWCKI